jgi:hypothetical protein
VANSVQKLHVKQSQDQEALVVISGSLVALKRKVDLMDEGAGKGILCSVCAAF